jgi:NTP pyrophosphatase (non-canonical NTP hydrolase)
MPQDIHITTMRDAQKLIKEFAISIGSDDSPSIDKFDHLHEELIEMSKHLRYKSEDERKILIKARKEIFTDGIGDLFFALCRLANQLDVDIEDAFNMVHPHITSRYAHRKESDGK